MFPLIDQLEYWIRERYHIFTQKESGFPQPWTVDSILSTYRFCNVHRENDTVTKWITENWREPFRDDPDLWFALTISRLLNNPESMGVIGFPVPWQKDRFKTLLQAHKSKGLKVFNAAYIVSTNGVAMDKIEYLAERVLEPLWNNREKIRPREADTLLTFFDRITKFDGIGSFIGGQIIADLKYAQLKEARDWVTFAVPGPGSLRGMRRLIGLSVDNTSQDRNWKKNLLELSDEINERCSDIPLIDCQNLQNCLCEFDKFIRAKTGEGRPKQLYRSK